MSRRTAGIALAVVAIVGALTAAVLWLRQQQEHAAPVVQDTTEIEVVTGPTEPVDLYFPGRGGRLYAERRELGAEGTTEQRLVVLLEELFAGPRSPELYPALPEEISLGWVLLNPDGIAYVDLEVGGETPTPAWGSRWEMLAVFSVVDTILLNVPEIRGVVILRNGQQRPTFAGHLDTTRPLVANRDLLAAGGS